MTNSCQNVATKVVYSDSEDTDSDGDFGASNRSRAKKAKNSKARSKVPADDFPVTFRYSDRTGQAINYADEDFDEEVFGSESDGEKAAAKKRKANTATFYLADEEVPEDVIDQVMDQRTRRDHDGNSLN